LLNEFTGGNERNALGELFKFGVQWIDPVS
jgi:hypothetical protein